ncbi:MAG: methyltransferase domain-containing protein [Acidimicrobiales bacterium]
MHDASTAPLDPPVPDHTGSHTGSHTRPHSGSHTGAAIADPPEQDTPELFDAPSRWRAEAARALELHGDELVAAVSPAAGCPAVLASVLASLRPADGRLDRIVDLGAGVGGIGEWLHRRTGATVVAVEPAAGARAAARMLFPELDVRSGTAEHTSLDHALADAVVLCGVLSLIDDVGPVLAEAERIMRPGAVLAIADLCSSTDRSIASGPNVFRSIEQLTSLLAVRGWRVVEVGVGAPAPEARWADAARRVDAWIDDHHHDHPAYAVWRADKQHLERHAVAGDLVAGVVVARRGDA